MRVKVSGDIFENVSSVLNVSVVTSGGASDASQMPTHHEVLTEVSQQAQAASATVAGQLSGRTVSMRGYSSDISSELSLIILLAGVLCVITVLTCYLYRTERSLSATRKGSACEPARDSSDGQSSEQSSQPREAPETAMDSMAKVDTKQKQLCPEDTSSQTMTGSSDFVSGSSSGAEAPIMTVHPGLSVGEAGLMPPMKMTGTVITLGGNSRSAASLFQGAQGELQAKLMSRHMKAPKSSVSSRSPALSGDGLHPFKEEDEFEDFAGS